MNWTTLNIPSEGIALAELLTKCNLHLVYMCHNLFVESLKWTIPLMIPDQMVDYKVRFNIKECSIKFSNLMCLTLYDNKYSIADNSRDGDNSDYHTSSDTIIHNLYQRRRICSLYSQISKLTKLSHDQVSCTKIIKQKRNHIEN